MIARKSAMAFYACIVLYALFIFFTQWSLTAANMGNEALSGILSSSVTFVILPAILILVAYNIAVNFKYYAAHRWFALIFIAALLLVAIASKSISLTLPLLLGFIGLFASNKAIAKIVVLSFGLLLSLSWLLSLSGFNGGDTVSKPLFGVDSAEVTVVSAFGMSNPNAVMLIFFHIIALTLFLCRTKKQDFFAAMGLLLMTITISVSTGSTTGIIIGLCTILLVLFAKHGKQAGAIFRKLTPWMFLLVTLFTFFIAVNYGTSSSSDNEINSTLTGRPELWNLRIENKSYINLFGENDQYLMQKSGNAASTSFALDNMMLYILVYFGFVVYLVFFFIFYLGAKNIRDPALLAYIFAATLLMFMEKMELYSLVLIFLQKSITECYLLGRKSDKLGIDT